MRRSSAAGAHRSSTSRSVPRPDSACRAELVEEGLRNRPLGSESEDQAGQVCGDSGVHDLEPQPLPKSNEGRSAECKQCVDQIDNRMVVKQTETGFSREHPTYGELAHAGSAEQKNDLAISRALRNRTSCRPTDSAA